MTKTASVEAIYPRIEIYVGNHNVSPNECDDSLGAFKKWCRRVLWLNGFKSEDMISVNIVPIAYIAKGNVIRKILKRDSDAFITSHKESFDAKNNQSTESAMIMKAVSSSLYGDVTAILFASFTSPNKARFDIGATNLLPKIMNILFHNKDWVSALSPYIEASDDDVYDIDNMGSGYILSEYETKKIINNVVSYSRITNDIDNMKMKPSDDDVGYWKSFVFNPESKKAIKSFQKLKEINNEIY